jgi:phosphofructokinase-like protein
MARFALTTGGGDCPGLNAVIRAFVKKALRDGHEVVGIERAFHGLFEEGGTRLLGLDDVAGILPRGGTLLGTSNRSNPFAWAVRAGDRWSEVDRSDELLERLRALGVEGLVAVGGDGSMAIAHRLTQKGLRVIGVPKTIDNDLSGTDQTFGFDTARAIATDAVDKLHSTAEAHDRVMVLEVMGRNAGFIALDAGIAGGADVILLPEIPWRIEPVVEAIRRRQRRGRSFSVAVVAEGARPLGGGQSVAEEAACIPGRGVVRLGGAGRVLAEALCERIDLEVRVTVLGHLQRGGGPSPFDRLLGSRLGVHAATLAGEDRWHRLVVLRGDAVTDVELSPGAVAPRTVDVHGEQVRCARELGICLGE